MGPSGKQAACGSSRVFSAAQLFDLIYREETLFNVIKSVTRNGRSILLTALLALILVYLFSIVGFLFLKDDFILEVDRLPSNHSRGLWCLSWEGGGDERPAQAECLSCQAPLFLFLGSGWSLNSHQPASLFLGTDCGGWKRLESLWFADPVVQVKLGTCGSCPCARAGGAEPLPCPWSATLQGQVHCSPTVESWLHQGRLPGGGDAGVRTRDMMRPGPWTS